MTYIKIYKYIKMQINFESILYNNSNKIIDIFN